MATTDIDSVPPPPPVPPQAPPIDPFAAFGGYSYTDPVTGQEMNSGTAPGTGTPYYTSAVLGNDPTTGASVSNQATSTNALAGYRNSQGVGFGNDFWNTTVTPAQQAAAAQGQGTIQQALQGAGNGALQNAIDPVEYAKLLNASTNSNGTFDLASGAVTGNDPTQAIEAKILGGQNLDNTERAFAAGNGNVGPEWNTQTDPTTGQITVSRNTQYLAQNALDANGQPIDPSTDYMGRLAAAGQITPEQAAQFRAIGQTSAAINAGNGPAPDVNANGGVTMSPDALRAAAAADPSQNPVGAVGQGSAALMASNPFAAFGPSNVPPISGQPPLQPPNVDPFAAFQTTPIKSAGLSTATSAAY